MSSRFALICAKSYSPSCLSSLITRRYELPCQLISRHALFSVAKQDVKSYRLNQVRYFKGRSNLVNQTSRKSLSPAEEVNGVSRGFSSLLKPFGFTVLIGTSSFAGAIVWQYENMRRHARDMLKGIAGNLPSREKFYGKAGGLRQKMNFWWNTLQPGEKIAAIIIGLNVGVFVLWRVPQLSAVMSKYFTSSPMSTAVCWPMLLSSFSHYALFHMFANMYVLWSFAPAATKLFGPEQFLAMYVSGAMVAGFTSCVVKVLRRRVTPSLGASGAIMAILGAVCTAVPQTRLGVAFVDQIFPHSFSADSAMKCLILFDTMGVLFGWRLFDHAAHLGGMLFGIWYVKYGHELIWKRREALMQLWHSVRGKP